MYKRSDSSRASIRSFLFPCLLFFRGSHTTSFVYMRLQQVVQPGGPGSFFKRDLQLSTQPVDKVQNDVRFGLDHAFHHDLSSSIPDRNRNTFLVHIHADIFSADHKGAPPLERLSEALKPYSTRGALLYCRVGPSAREIL